MEYVEGISLTELVEERGALPPELARRIAEQIFHAVGSAHDVGIVHRDLSTNNIRVKLGEDDVPETRVLDFGIAKSTRSRTAAWTKPGLGTPLWVAPEQHLSGYVPSPSGDVWALGLLMFFLLTGRIYWKHAQPGATSLGDLSMEILRHPLATAFERASELGVRELLPAHFDAWFARAVTRSVEERYVDATEAGTALWQVFDGEEPAEVKPRSRRSAPPASVEPASLGGSPVSAEPAPISSNAGALERAEEGSDAEPASRPGSRVPSGRVLLLVLATLVLAGYGLYWALNAARL
jgi:serine/threonine-protein kinase